MLQDMDDIKKKLKTTEKELKDSEAEHNATLVESSEKDVQLHWANARLSATESEKLYLYNRVTELENSEAEREKLEIHVAELEQREEETGRLRLRVSELEDETFNNTARIWKLEQREEVNQDRIAGLEQKLLEAKATAEKNKDAQKKLLHLKRQWSSMSNILGNDSSYIDHDMVQASAEGRASEVMERYTQNRTDADLIANFRRHTT